MNCGKKKYSLFDELTCHDLVVLESNRSVVDYKKGETIYKEGTKPMGLLCLNQGKVKLVKNSQNNAVQIIGLRRPVDFIDVRTVVSGNSYSHSAIALEDSSVCFIDASDFLEVMKNNTNLTLKIMCMLASELDNADDRFINMTQKFLRARLAETILRLKDFYGTLADGKTIDCIVKRADLAGLSNMNVANVIRTLSAFKQEGIISNNNKNITIKNEMALRSISAE